MTIRFFIFAVCPVREGAVDLLREAGPEGGADLYAALVVKSVDSRGSRMRGWIE